MNIGNVLSRSYFIKHTWLFILSIGVLLILFGVKLASVHAENINIDSARNCDANAVIWCGAGSDSSLISKFNKGDGHNSAASIQNIFSFFGITSADVNSMTNSAVDVQSGSVTSGGDVIDSNGKIVATKALTGGRQDISGSTRVTSGGTTFFVRSPKVSFVSSPLAAYVVMKDGRFAFAILASCGNPIKAMPTTPAPKPKPAPAPATTTPTSPPSQSICNGNTTNSNSGIASQGGNCSTNTTVVQTQNNSPSPAAQCTSLQVAVNQNDMTNINATVNFEAQNGAVLQNVVFDFGDGTILPASTQTSASHTFSQSGTFTIKATLTFSSNSQPVSPSVCQAIVSVATPSPTPTPPATTTTSVTPAAAPTTLVNTGPGDDIAIFGLVTVVSTLAYRQYIKSRLAASSVK